MGTGGILLGGGDPMTNARRDFDYSWNVSLMLE